MRCSRAQYLYEEYAAGLLDSETAQRIDEHLAACVLCREFYESNDDLGELITHANEVVHPGAPYMTRLSDQVLNRLASGPKGGKETDLKPRLPGINPWFRPIWWSGAVAALVLLALGMMPEEGFRWPTGLTRTGSWKEFQSADSFRIPSREWIEPANSAPGNQPSANRSLASQPVASARRGENPVGISLSKSVTKPEQANGNGQELDSRSAVLGILGRGQNPKGPVQVSSLPARRSNNLSVRVSPEAAREMILLDVQGTSEARNQINAMIEEMNGRGDQTEDEESDRGNTILFQQYTLYRRAEEALGDHRPESALKIYQSVLELDPNSSLAQRACLRIADLHYGEWAAFDQAREYYRRCLDLESGSALTPLEIAQVRGRLGALDRFESSGWKPLALAHKVAREDWNSAASALKEICAGDDARALLADAARTVALRMRNPNGPDDKTALSLIETLKGAMDLSGDVSARAWIRLALAETIWIRFQNESAIKFYEEVLALDANSQAGAVAQERLAQIRARNLEAGPR